MQAWAPALFADVERGIAAVHSAREIAQVEPLPGLTEYSGQATGTIEMTQEEITAD